MMDTPFPPEIPVMVLEGVTFFPNTFLPLYIFEPRYRRMLRFALESDRIFAVAMPRAGLDGEVFDIAGAGLIRACVENADGTSNLVLQGMRRVRFSGWKQMKPFRIAGIEPLSSRNNDSPETAALAAEIQQLCIRLREQDVKLPKELESCLQQSVDADMFSDVVIPLLVRDAKTRQSLLEEMDVTQRLKSLLVFLRKASGE